MKSIRIVGSLILLMLFTALTLPESPPSDGYKVGDYATDFSLKNVDGRMVSLSNYKDARGFLVIFTCNTCPYAVAYQDRIIALDKKYRPQGVPLIAINPNNPSVQPGDSFEKMQERAKNKGFTFPYLLDEGQKIFPMYGATRTPHVFLLEDTDEGYLVRYIGTIDDNYQDASRAETHYVQDAVDAMLEGKPIEVETTRAIGCSIKV